MFVVREAVESDHACVFATWLHSYRHNSQFTKRIPDGIYYSKHHSVIENLLKRSKLVIATTEEDTSVILGWSCYESSESIAGLIVPAIIHYVYVKPDFRKAGVATKLLEEVAGPGVMYSHETFMVRGLMMSKLKRPVFNPYAAMTA